MRLHLIAANVAAMAFQTGLEEERVHVDVGDELTLLFRELTQDVLQEEVLHVDHDHGKGLQAPL